MSNPREVVVVSGCRTAIGDYGGSLKDIAATELAAHVVREAVKRSKVDPNDVGHCVFGNVIHGEPKDMYLSRVACLKGGLPEHTPALTLNRLCGSGLQAIVSASQTILLGDTDVAVAGGVESMSRGGYLVPSLRWGQRMNDGGVVDMMVGALTDPFDTVHMGITAENVAEKWKISREKQDELAVESHRRAVAATEKGYFKDQIAPFEIKTRKGTTVFDKDEHPRADATLEGLAKLRAVFKKDGSVTAGNASGINDAAAAVVLMEKSAAEKRGLKPMARLKSYALAGVDPKYMGIGPVPASKKALERAGLKVGDMDVIEANEAFAAQALAVACDLNFDMNKTNPNGGGIGLGHPIGATGCIVTVKALYELQRTGGKYALVTMCIGG
ncbi:MAG TPA: acetyl-CoA C-acyltransferase family protein, partial [Burkholderiales bacterium]|nr:acetyl-CoA C-acyltransferase family protein [Burkholderiales bacterium]